jgi:hypothetical protein
MNFFVEVNTIIITLLLSPDTIRLIASLSVSLTFTSSAVSKGILGIIESIGGGKDLALYY